MPPTLVSMQPNTHRFQRLKHLSERYLKTDIVYLVRGGFWVLGGQFFSSALVLASTVAFANLITPEAYGTYRYAFSILSILGITTLTGINQALVPAIVAGYEHTAKAAERVQRHAGYIGTVIALCFAGYSFYTGDPLLSVLFSIVAVFLPFWETVANYDAVLVARKKFRESTQYATILNASVTFCAVLALALTRDIRVVLFVYLGTYTLGRYLISRHVYHHETVNAKVDWSAIGYGKHLSLMGVLPMIAAQCDKVIMFHFLGPAQLAIYAFATAPVEQARGILKSLSTLALPKFSDQSIAQVQGSLREKRFRVIFALLILVGAYLFTCPFFFTYVLPKYTAAISLSQLYALSLLGIGSGLAQAALITQRRQRALYWYNGANAIVGIALSFIGIATYGIIGAIVAKTVSNILSGISLEVLASR